MTRKYMDYGQASIDLHKKSRGKIEIRSKVGLKSKKDLSLAYTPGVGAVSMAIRKNRRLAGELTNRGNSVAIVSDGTAVLGLGNIGPLAALPVMEGKSVIFKKLAGVDAVPLCVNTTDPDEIVKFCRQIEPSFGGINLEDISSPRCFEISRRLKRELDIPVFHDDQDGTAIVILAGLINACRVTGKALRELNYVINGAGAAGLATAGLLLAHGVKRIVILDSIGTIYKGRKYLNPYKAELAAVTNRKKIRGRLEEALVGADVFIGVSKPHLADKRMIRSMNSRPIIFALANPVPEIFPEDAYAAGAGLVGTGRSDYPNQINNALVFPGLFRGLLSARKTEVTEKMKLRAALALAHAVKPAKNMILPNVMNKAAVSAVAQAVVSSR